MALRYPGEWKFDGVGFGVPPDAVDDFARLLLKTAGNSKDLIERFKRSFGRMQTSSSWEWAVQDLESGMRDQAENAAAFVDAIWECIETAKESGVTVPTPSTVNRMLETHHIALRLEPPDLKLTIAGSVTDGPPASSSADSGHQLTFVLGEEIGRGGYGTVYKATRTTNVATFEYAVKLFEPSPFIENVDKARQRFEREIRALSAVQHRAIVQLVDAGITSERKAYIAMPLIVGANLAVACQHWELRPILEVFVEILRALQTAHEASVIHRDLMPTNVMVRASDRQPIIVDFGASYIRDELSEKNLTTTVVGTRGYIPPEVLADPALRSNRQDVYACGAMLYQLLAGRLPSTSEYAPLEAVKPEYRRLDPVILRSLATFDKRTSSALVFAEELLEVQEQISRSRGGQTSDLSRESAADPTLVSFRSEFRVVERQTASSLILDLQRMARTPVRHLGLAIQDLSKWSEVLGDFVVVPEFDEANETWMISPGSSMGKLHVDVPASYTICSIEGQSVSLPYYVADRGRGGFQFKPGVYRLDAEFQSPEGRLPHSSSFEVVNNSARFLDDADLNKLRLRDDYGFQNLEADIIRWVDLDYPVTSGLKQVLDGKGYNVRWSTESRLTNRLEREGWSPVIQQDDQGRMEIFKVRDRPEDLTLIKIPKSPLSTSATKWWPETSLNRPRAWHTGMTAGNHIYVIGGWDRLDGIASPERHARGEFTRVQPDGSLTSWQPTPPTATLRSGAATFLFGKYLYVLGGERYDTDSATSVERAEILADGSLSPWEVVGHLTAGRWGLSAVLVERDLYIIGGHDATDPLAAVEHAKLDEAGNLGRWSKLANLNVPRWALSAVHLDGYIFALGGQDKQNTHRTVERARITEDGLLEGWTMISSMTERRHGARVVAHDRRLIVTGGYSGIGAGATPPQEYLSSVESATLSPGGDLGAWSNVSSMRSRRGYHTAAVMGESLYVVGGMSPSAASSSVERIDLDRLQKA